MLSIIIIEYHCMDDVLRCIESVEEHLGSLEHESIVLSNSCYKQDQINTYEGRMEGAARLVAAQGNLGYAGGVNAALKETRGEYVYILNPDCLLTDAGVVSIIEQMESDPKWVISGPKVIDDNGSVQPSCRRFPRPWTFILVRSFFSRLPMAHSEQVRYLMTSYDHDVTGPVDWVSGGAMLVKVSLLKKLGGMDERYFLYMEDVDWCHTAWSLGLKVMYCPQSVVVHSGQHKSIQGGVFSLFSKHVRMHVKSMAKYFIKFGLSAPKHE
ncbi:MAG: glycosyltransferase family 2 protein [Gammaproteobacteria bacterium]|nr:glycosyltransferase family 2 protein [Gammaproteobacteria bacterium]